MYARQQLFDRDNHNHTEVLGERYFGLPLLLPENQRRTPFVYVNAETGKHQAAPYSTDNVMHTDWVASRLVHNRATPIGSDSDIYFQNTIPGAPNVDDYYEGTPQQQGYTRWQDWLDHNAAAAVTTKRSSIDEKVARTCADGNDESMVCSMTCTDWWTNRPVPPQGSLASPQGGGGCPWGTVQSLACYPCSVHSTYVKGTPWKSK